MSSGAPGKSHAAYTGNNRVRLVRGGREYFDCLRQLIDRAQESLHLQTYIFANDETGKQVAGALVSAARRNVSIYIMADGYASQEISHRFARELTDAGIHFRFFEPLFRSRYYYFGRRLHHKLVVADTKYALVGGINVSNNYNDMPGEPAWLDFALYAEGEIAQQLCILCWKTWNGYPPHMGPTPCERDPPRFHIPAAENCLVRMRRNDWVRRKNEISGSYREMFRKATDQIIIVSSYFLPGKEFRTGIWKAAHRGVIIKLVLAGASDVWIAKQAERYMYRWLLKNNIEVYEYQPSILHAKMTICDGKWLTLGSYNLNNISAFASIELNLDVNNEPFARSVKEKIEGIIAKDCVRITMDNLMTKNTFWQRLWQGICYESIRILFYLFTFYFKQKE
jgi:cardiolipin synthase